MARRKVNRLRGQLRSSQARALLNVYWAEVEEGLLGVSSGSCTTSRGTTLPGSSSRPRIWHTAKVLPRNLHVTAEKGFGAGAEREGGRPRSRDI